MINEYFSLVSGLLNQTKTKVSHSKTTKVFVFVILTLSYLLLCVMFSCDFVTVPYGVLGQVCGT